VLSKRTVYQSSTVLAITLLFAGCGGGGGGGDNAPAAGNNAPQAVLTAQSLPLLPANNSAIQTCPTMSNYSLAAPPASAEGKISGRVTFDRVPFSPTLGLGLDYANQNALPARGVVVEALTSSAAGHCSGSVVATALTDGDGWYELTPDTGNAAVCVRARAQLYRASDTTSAARWNISVADNTSADELYVLEESSAASAAVRGRRDLHAASGWSNSAYNGARAAAPFAILDTACKAMNAVIAAKPAAQFGALTYFWSTKNTSTTNGRLADGKIGGAFFSSSPAAIYLRGDAAVDTDEFDEMVIAHEFGHFVTYTFSRSDSIGGDHSLSDYVDPRVAFDEGWATAFAGLVLHTATYRDSTPLRSSVTGSYEFFFNLQHRYGNVPTGWYSETSVQRALFTIGADASFNGLGIGLEGLLQTFSGDYKITPALTMLFSYASQLKGDQPIATANDIAYLLNAENMNGNSVQPFAEAETNAMDMNDLPVYQVISLTSPQQTVCSDNDDGEVNKLSNRRYLRFDVSAAGNYSFTVQPQNGYAQAVAGFELLDRGNRLAYVVGAESSTPNRSVHYSTSTPLSSGTYVLSVFHVGNVVQDSTVVPGRQCFNVSVAAI
jgi:hypothetical protein